MKKVKLTQNKYALVDDVDFFRINTFKWHAKKSRNIFYAMRTTSKGTILMHRYILKPGKKLVDHKDGNGLNNQRHNLRTATFSQNKMNTGKSKNNKSGFKGVYGIKVGKKWRAVIRVNGKRIHLGLFITKLQAYEAYSRACIKYHKEFAKIK